MASQSRGSSSPNSRATTQFSSSAARRLLSRCDRKSVLYSLAMLSTVFFVMLVAWATSSDERGAALLREDSLGHHILMERVIPHITATHTGAVRDDRLSAVVVNGASRSRHPWRAYFIAMNLFNNAPLIPRFAENLAMFISEELRRKGSVDVPARVFISIFSNGNSDTTSEDINNILVPALEAAGVPRDRRMHVVPSGNACGGFQRKPKHMDRIVWMACIRNEAMRPLYDEGLGLFDPNRRARSSSDQSFPTASPLSQVEGDSATPVLNESALPPHYLELPLPDGSTLTSDNTVVLFLNDIVFLPSDMTKLLETNYARSQRLVNYNRRWRSHQKSFKKDGNTDDPNINNNNEAEGEEEPVLTTERGFSSLWDGFNMACGMDFYASFYDQWVTRDYDGRPFDAYPPYARDFGTQQIFYEAEALRSSGASHHVNDHQPRHTSAPARCCWNGAAAIRSSMFLRHDIRFRMPVSNMFNMSRGSDSCYSSECMLICKDIMQAATCEKKAEEAEEQQQRSSALGKKRSSSSRDLLDIDCPVLSDVKKKKKLTSSGAHVLAPSMSEDTWVDVGGIFINPHVKVTYDEENFALHHEQWFVSSVWFYRIVSFLRVTTWLLPDEFEPPGGDSHPTWMECVLPEDTLPIVKVVWTYLTGTISGWCLIGMFIIAAALYYTNVRSGSSSTTHSSHAGGVTGRMVALIDTLGRAIPCHSIRLLFRRGAVAFGSTTRRRTNSSSGGGAVPNLRLGGGGDDGSGDNNVTSSSGTSRVVVAFGGGGSPIVSPTTSTTPSSGGGGFGGLVIRRSAAPSGPLSTA